jgi:NADH dehydrogenase FAD-containing subunit
MRYDYLVYALGSRQDTDAVEGVGEHALALDSLEAAKAMHQVLVQQKPSSEVLVVGGGLTGIETATEVVESFPHLRVKLAIDQPFKAQNRPGGYSPDAVAYLQRSLAQRGVSVQTGCRINRVRQGTAETTSSGSIGYDVCIWTGGFTPVPYAAEAGIQVNPSGQIVTDASLRSLSHPNIIAIGDAAQAGTSEGGTCRMGCATALAMASTGAQTVAALLAGEEPPVFRFVYLFRNISLGRNDGLIQFVDANDMPRNLVWTGTLAVRWKEYICNGTLATVGLHPQAKMPALPPLRMLPQLLRGANQYA